MTNLAKALTRLREERREAQHQVQKLGEAISVLEKITRSGGGTHGGSSFGVKRVLSAAGRRRISLAQKARWAKVRQMKKAA